MIFLSAGANTLSWVRVDRPQFQPILYGLKLLPYSLYTTDYGTFFDPFLALFFIISGYEMVVCGRVVVFCR